MLGKCQMMGIKEKGKDPKILRNRARSIKENMISVENL